MVTAPNALRSILLSGFCASALLVGACSGGDKPPAEEITVDAATLDLTRADESALSDHFTITARPGDDATTLALLDALNLEPAAYGDRVIDGSGVTYTNWSSQNDDSTVTAQTVQMIGLHETDAGPTLDKLVVSGLRIENSETVEIRPTPRIEIDDPDATDDSDAEVADASDVETFVNTVEASIEGLVVVAPSSALLLDIVDVLMARDEGRDAVGEMTGDQPFRAMQVENFVAEVVDRSGSGDIAVQQFVVGNDPAREQLDLVIESVAFDWTGDAPDGRDAPFELAMDGLTVLGLDMASANMGAASSGPTSGFPGVFANIFTPRGAVPYRQVDLGQMSLVSDMFDLSTDGFEADTVVDGAKTTMRSVLSPMVITLKDVGTTPIAPYMDVLRENGLAELTLKGSQTLVMDSETDRMVVTDSQFDIDDGLRMDCDYVLQGVNASAQSLEESGVTAPMLQFDETADGEADIDAYMADLQAYQAAQAEANALLKIESLRCDVQDVPGNSLVDRGYAVAAAVTGRPVAVLKGGAKTMIAMGSMMAPSDFERNLMDVVGTGLIDFIDTPGQTMTIVMAPETPVSVTTLTGEGGGERSLEPLGLSVEVN